MMSNKSCRLVVAAVLERDGRYLVCQRAADKHHGGLWEFPGGKLELGETLEHAAERELREELQLSVCSVGDLLFTYLDDSSGCVINFMLVEAEGEPVLAEHSACLWLSPRELESVCLAPTDKEFCRQVLSKIERKAVSFGRYSGNRY